MTGVGLGPKYRVKGVFPTLLKFHSPEGDFTKNPTQPYIPTPGGRH